MTYAFIHDKEILLLKRETKIEAYEEIEENKHPIIDEEINMKKRKKNY